MVKTSPRKLFAQYWQPFMWYGLLVLAFGGLLWYKLGSLTGGYGPAELSTLHASNSWQHILNNPLNAPFTIMGRLTLYLEHHGIYAMRLSAAAIGLASLSVFYWLVRHWHGERAAIIGTVLFGASGWFLHVSRLGTPDVLLFGIMLLVACNIWLRRSRSWYAVLASMVVATALVYVPGMIWFIVIGVLWQWRSIDRVFKENLWSVSLGALIFLGALTPLGLAIYHTPELAKSVAGLPADGWPQVFQTLHNLASVPVNLVLHGPADAQRWLVRLPVLDYFSLGMATLGAWLYIKHAKLRRVKLVAGVLVIGTLLIGLGGAVNLTLIVPFLYILAAVGIDFMLQRWFTVFPRNVIAQATGTGLIILALLATGWFSLRSYFRAWPNAPATKAVFTLADQRVPSGTIKK